MNRARYWFRLGLVLGWLSAGLCPASAHDFLSGYIQHRAEITVGAKNIDVTLRLTFFEDGSDHERKHIDANADGRLSREELAAYLEKSESVFEKSVTLEINGQSVPLITLYPPALDLLGHDRVGRERHVLTLYLFARTPSDLRAGAELCVKDALWPEFRAIAALHASGRDGSQIEARPAGDEVLSNNGKALSFAARVLKPPAQTPASAPRKP